jgi:hypothetical protein
MTFNTSRSTDAGGMLYNGDLHVPARGFPFTGEHVSTSRKPNCTIAAGKNAPMKGEWNTTMLHQGKAYARYAVLWPGQSVS